MFILTSYTFYKQVMLILILIDAQNLQNHFHAVPFCVVIFSCCTFFVMHSFYVLYYFMLHFYTLQCFHFAFFCCCTFRMLHFFLLHFAHVALLAERVPVQSYNMESFTTIIDKTANTCCKALYLRCLLGASLRLYHFPVALSSCWTF